MRKLVAWATVTMLGGSVYAFFFWVIPMMNDWPWWRGPLIIHSLFALVLAISFAIAWALVELEA